jgi:hypothetical protein
MYRWLCQCNTARDRRWTKGGWEAFVESPLADIDNGATRMLAAREDVASIPLASPVTENDYRLAAERLAEFSVVGVYERLGDYVRALGTRYGWAGPLTLPRVHISKTQTPKVTGSAAKRLRERNEFDWMLYEQVLTRLATENER